MVKLMYTFLFLKPSAEGEVFYGNQRFEGFCVDLLEQVTFHFKMRSISRHVLYSLTHSLLDSLTL